MRVRIQSELREQRGALLWISHGDADAHQHVERRAATDLESCGVSGRFLSRAEHKIFRRVAGVRQRVLPSVDQPAAHLRRHVDDERSGTEIAEDDIIRRGRIRREDAKAILITEELTDVPALRADGFLPVLPFGERHGGQRPEIQLAGALKVAFIIELLDRFLGRVAVGKVVGELQLADVAIDGLVFRKGR